MMKDIAELFRTICAVIFAIIEFSIILRIIFKLLDANTSSNFVQNVYDFTDSFVNPFSGVFDNIVISDNYIIDINAFLAWLIIAFGFVLFSQIMKILIKSLN